MSDGNIVECVQVECATEGCNRVHVIVLLKDHVMNPDMLIHCMFCLSTMGIKIVSVDKATGEVGVERRVSRTSEQLREIMTSEVNKRCPN